MFPRTCRHFDGVRGADLHPSVSHVSRWRGWWLRSLKTCEQFRGYAITDPNNIALWLSGYYNGQRNNTIIKVESFKENLEKVKDYCITNPKVTVMQAVSAVLGNGKQ